MPEQADRYTHGHHASVLRSHSWRTAQNSAGFLLPRLHAGDDLLDVGCGPGTISADLAALVAPGYVTGIDLVDEVIITARETNAPRGLANLRFAVDDVYQLSFDDASFDVVYAHQVLQHLGDPVGALREMGRVLRPGGLLAVRDADFGAFVWYPDDERLTRWLELYHQLTGRNNADADAGRHLIAWVREAGFSSVEASSSNWTFHTPSERAWWGGLWAERVRESAFAAQALEYGLTTTDELDAISAAFRSWSEADDGVFIVVHGEVLATRER
jgi:ubiquinone/menaquinone biosynthesis C-methylase UbiE